MCEKKLKIPKKGNQNPYIEKGQAIQWSKDTIRVIRIRISRMDKQYNGQKIPQG